MSIENRLGRYLHPLSLETLDANNRHYPTDPSLPCALTAVAGRHSYAPVSHPDKFPHGLTAPMTTDLIPAGTTLFSFSIRGPGKAMGHSREGT